MYVVGIILMLLLQKPITPIPPPGGTATATQTAPTLTLPTPRPTWTLSTATPTVPAFEYGGRRSYIVFVKTSE